MTPAPSPVADIRVCEPSTRPGAPLPEAWIDGEDGKPPGIARARRAGPVLLIAGEDGDAWCGAARRLAADAEIPGRCRPHRALSQILARPAGAVLAAAREGIRQGRARPTGRFPRPSA